MDKENDSQKGPYDLALFIAKSFGQSLPIVIITALIAIGAWYFVRELSTLNSSLIDAREKASEARIKQVEAESAAKTATDKARIAILSEQSKRIAEINETSVAVSKKIQELVMAQLQNMTQLEARSASQSASDERRRKERADEASGNIKKLKDQITELEKKRLDLISSNAIAGYKEVRTKLVEELEKGYLSGADSIIDLLRPKLSSPELETTVSEDMHNKNITWRYRALLLIEIYRMSGNKIYLNDLAQLLNENKPLLDSYTGQLLQGRSQWSKDAAMEITQIALKWIIDDSINSDVRFSFFNGIGYGDFPDKYIASINIKYRELAAKRIATLYLANIDRYCSQPLDLLYKLSMDAAVTIAHTIKDRSHNQSTRECIDRELTSWGNPPPPTKQMQQEWATQ